MLPRVRFLGALLNSDCSQRTLWVRKWVKMDRAGKDRKMAVSMRPSLQPDSTDSAGHESYHRIDFSLEARDWSYVSYFPSNLICELLEEI